MHDYKKIKIMAELAVYDKNHAGEDMARAKYFRHDYIYRKNMRNRVCVFVGCLIVILFYELHRIVFDGLDIFAMDYGAELVKIILFFAIMLIGYTLIGTVLYTAAYHQSKSRLDRYYELLQRLERLEKLKRYERETKRYNYTEEDGDDYGTDYRTGVNFEGIDD